MFALALRRQVARSDCARHAGRKQRSAGRSRWVGTPEFLESRWLLVAGPMSWQTPGSDLMPHSAVLESEDLRQAGELVVQLDTDRALYRDRFGQFMEMVWEPVVATHDVHEQTHGSDQQGDQQHGGDGGVFALADDITYTPAGVPILDSFPSAPAAVYLDFDGNFEPRWGSARNVITPPYDLDSNPSSFNSEEQGRIVEIWQRVSEDFAPFNVNVTTRDTSDAATTLNELNTSVDRVRTFYFRTEFHIADAAQVSNLVFNILRDDGVAVYLNGTEVVRDNLPPDAGYRDFAQDSVGGDDEDTYFSYPVNAGLLVNGTNVLAVELHQESDTSSDTSFDMSAIATVAGVPVQFLLPTGATWSYLDDGSDQGTAWRQPTFDSSSWPLGAGKFGYGNDGVVTPLEVYEAGAPRVRTSYFRHEFQVDDPSQVTTLNLGLLRDDGAAVYINGVEVVRDNLATNADFDDFATETVSGAEENIFYAFAIPSSVLVPGRNVVAVEVHQDSDTSSDVSFDLRLIGSVGGNPGTVLLAEGSTWKYLDDGSDQGTAWRASEYDDATWRTGQAQFGYGDVQVGTVRVAIGPETWYEGGAGGVAFVNSFDIDGTTTVFSFTNGAGNSAKNLGEVSSHEAGHAFGLGHQSTFDPDTGEKLEEYNPGSGDWGPIMGVSYSPSLTTWHNGPTGSAQNLQDDMTRISRPSNEFGYRTDDHGNSAASATPLSSQGGSFQQTGIIAENDDVDAFSFSIAGSMQGGIRVELQPAEIGPNLDAQLEIRNSSNAIVASANPANSLGAVLDVSLPPGTYTLLVRSSGDYGRVGQYTLIGDLDESLVSLEGFSRTGPLGSQSVAGDIYQARTHFADDVDQFSLFGQAGQWLTAAVTPSNPTTLMTVEVPGLTGPVSAAEPGAAIQLPLTLLSESQEYLIHVTGTQAGAYTVQWGLNTVLESPGTSDSVAVPIDGSDAGELAGRLSVSGHSGDGSDAARTLIARGANWKYLDDGSNQGTAWRQPQFDDSDWSSGLAEFGYGDGDELTVLDETRSGGSRVRTYYFRHTFHVSDASLLDNFELALKRDDGAAVYLNGVEIRRDNLAPSATFDTFALDATDDEDLFLSSSHLAGLLVNGDNVLAVEVHQDSDTSSDVSFDLELRANVVLDGALQWSVVPAGSQWHYIDDGSNQGTAWRQPDFDDSSWSTGLAELGYGDPAVTELDPTRSNGSRIRTFYFRREFHLNSVDAFDRAALWLLRDDGAAVYLNGVEIRRDNLPANAGFDQLATTTVSGSEEETFIATLVDMSLLVEGRNVLAVEVHQDSDGSSDVSFDLELVLEQLPQHVDSIFEAGDTWKYLDNGSNQGTAWRNPLFNDSAWSSGTGQFGYGDGDETTELDEDNSSGQRIRTFYFRKGFVVSDPNDYKDLVVSLLYDDGAAVYLNGSEIIRENLTDDAAFDDLATGLTDDENAFFDYTIDASLLVAGENTIAVEVHQESDTSSDVSFDLSLRARRATPEVDRFTFEVQPDQVGMPWTILLDGADQDFSGEALELIGPDGETVVASAVSGATSSNYDLGILNVSLDAAGTYTLRLESRVQGRYGIALTRDVQLELEPNDSVTVSGNTMAVGQPVWGYIASPEDVDHFTVQLVENLPVTFFTSSPFDHPLGVPGNDVDPELSVMLPDGTVLESAPNGLDGKNVFLSFTPEATGDYVVRLGAASGSGEYTLTAALAGDANLDGSVDGLDMAVWTTHRFRSEGVRWKEADFNGDGFVDGRDFGIWNRYKFTSYSATARASEPERGLPRAAVAGHTAAAVQPAAAEVRGRALTFSLKNAIARRDASSDTAIDRVFAQLDRAGDRWTARSV